MNDERPKLHRLIGRRDFDVLLVEHKDRLTRFGFHWFEALAPFRIEVVNTAEEAARSDGRPRSRHHLFCRQVLRQASGSQKDASRQRGPQVMIKRRKKSATTLVKEMSFASVMANSPSPCRRRPGLRQP